MIRKFNSEDTEELRTLIGKIDTGYIVSPVEEIQDRAKKVIVYDSKRIKGFAYTTESISDFQEREAQLYIYVEPQSRKQGIGTALYEGLMEYINNQTLEVLTAYMRTDIVDTGPFCEKMGFEKWWGSPELVYTGSYHANIGLQFEKYDDRFHDQYVELTQQCFYDMRKKNDLKPYIVTESMVDQYSLVSKDNIYIAINDNDELLATITIGDGTIDNLFVNREHQRKGYAKQALQFGLNELLARGSDDIRICYLEGNTSAEKLYYSLGFEFLQNTQVYRKFV